MYDPKTGIWFSISKEDWREHFEVTYYIKYNVNKALFSLDKILAKKVDYSGFASRSEYYHFYTDSLLSAITHINRRFNNNKANDETIKRNRKEYDYIDNNTNKCNYQSLGSRTIRNFIEHIDENDEKLINLGIYNGTFNVIYNGMNLKVKKDLLSDKNKQNNLLNLIKKEYKIMRIKEGGETLLENIKEYTINLLKVKEDILKMKNINDKIFCYLANNRF